MLYFTIVSQSPVTSVLISLTRHGPVNILSPFYPSFYRHLAILVSRKFMAFWCRLLYDNGFWKYTLLMYINSTWSYFKCTGSSVYVVHTRHQEYTHALNSHLLNKARTTCTMTNTRPTSMMIYLASETNANIYLFNSMLVYVELKDISLTRWWPASIVKVREAISCYMQTVLLYSAKKKTLKRQFRYVYEW